MGSTCIGLRLAASSRWIASSVRMCLVARSSGLRGHSTRNLARQPLTQIIDKLIYSRLKLPHCLPPGRRMNGLEIVPTPTASASESFIRAAGANTWAEKNSIKKRMHQMYHLNSQADRSQDREPNGDKITAASDNQSNTNILRGSQ